MPPDFLVVNRNEGAEWLAENYDLPIERVRAILAFYDMRAGSAGRAGD